MIRFVSTVLRQFTVCTICHRFWLWIIKKTIKWNIWSFLNLQFREFWLGSLLLRIFKPISFLWLSLYFNIPLSFIILILLVLFCYTPLRILEINVKELLVCIHLYHIMNMLVDCGGIRGANSCQPLGKHHCGLGRGGRLQKNPNIAAGDYTSTTRRPLH